MNRELATIGVRLYKSIGRLALPPEEQVEYLRTNGTPHLVDELALEFNNHALLVDQMVEEGFVEREEADAILGLDRTLDDMSGPQHSSLWEIDALFDAPEWEEVRQQARAVIRRE